MWQQPDEEEASNSKRENFTIQPPMKQGVSLEYADEVLDQLEKMTLQTINDKETRKTWLSKLSATPKWKLIKLSEYNYSKGLKGVWDYFDGLRRPEEPFKPIKSLPEPNSKVSKICCNYLDIIVSDVPSEVKDEAERNWVEEMKKLGVNVWCQRKANK